MTNRERAEQLYDSGPRFEAGNQTNREAWVKKIEEALDEVTRDLKNEVDALLEAHAADKGTVKQIGLFLQEAHYREGRYKKVLKYIYDQIDDEGSPSTSPFKWIKDSIEKVLRTDK